MESIAIFNLPLIEWIGYLASLLVLISLSLSSIVKLRLVNLVGAAVFSFYGFYIGALPVGIMNFIIVIADIYYLRQLYYRKERFDILEIHSNDPYLNKFISHYKEDIKKFFPDFFKLEDSDIILLALRDLNPAGVFAGDASDDTQLNIKVDYVTPQYRDYKLGKYIYTQFSNFFKDKGFKKLSCSTDIKAHKNYLKKMGFTPDDKEQSYTFDL